MIIAHDPTTGGRIAFVAPPNAIRERDAIESPLHLYRYPPWAPQAQTIVDPSAEYVLEERLREDAAPGESADPPEPGSSRS